MKNDRKKEDIYKGLEDNKSAVLLKDSKNILKPV